MTERKKNHFNEPTEHETIYIVKGKAVLKLKTKKCLEKSYILYDAPVQYGEQVPILIKLEKDTSSNVTYSIIDDKNEPNKLIKFSINDFKKEEVLTIHFSYWVLIKNRAYKDFPKESMIPKSTEIPDDIKKWLKSTESIQSDNFLIKFRAEILKRFDKKILKYVRKVSYYICYHRPILSKIRSIIEHKIVLRDFFLPKRYWTGLMDAISGLLFGGMCTTKATLGVALLRAVGIPSRVLVVNPLFYRVLKKTEWIDSMHYIIEFYVPSYGWVRLNPGKAPYQTKNDIILRVVYPEDENEAGNGLSYYGGMLPWFWFSDENIILDFPEDLYTDYKRPKSSGVPIASREILKKIKLDKKISKDVFNVANNSWKNYLDVFKNNDNLSKDSEHIKTIQFQEKAVESIAKSDTEGYIKNMQKVLKNLKE